MKSSNRLTEKQRQDILVSIAAVMSLRDIARKHNVPKQTICQIFDEYKASIDMPVTATTLKEVAVEHGVSRQTIYDIIEKNKKKA